MIKVGAWTQKWLKLVLEHKKFFFVLLIKVADRTQEILSSWSWWSNTRILVRSVDQSWWSNMLEHKKSYRSDHTWWVLKDPSPPPPPSRKTTLSHKRFFLCVNYVSCSLRRWNVYCISDKLSFHLANFFSNFS